jgi:SAM-dependent methyltransferase
MRSLETLLVFMLPLIFLPYLLNQIRKPTGWLGRFILWTMNLSHSDLTDWGLTHVRINQRFTILDIGCGGGRTIQKLAGAATQGMIYGVDFSNTGVAASRSKNSQLVKEGRVEIRQASVSHLPFPDNDFDLITAVETHYYWPNMVMDLQEIIRVLKPGAILIILAEGYNRSNKPDKLQWLEVKLMKFNQLNVEQHREMFSLSGFSDIQVFEKQDKGWICCTGIKPLGIVKLE